LLLDRARHHDRHVVPCHRRAHECRQSDAGKTKEQAQLTALLRDWRNNEVHPIDTRLLDLLADLHVQLGTSDPFNVISGYRSPQTNALLHERSSGVAAKSLHMQGMAIDIRLPDTQLRRVRDTALAMGRGGVGYYEASNFVHVDVGRVRRWTGA